MLVRRSTATLVAGVSLAAALVLASGVQSTLGANAAGAPVTCSRTEQLAYVAANFPGAKGVVWLASANGHNRRRLFAAANPELSPDGRMVAVTEFGHSAGLRIFTVCGRLVGEYFGAREGVSGIVWSPDSGLVAAVV